MIYTASINGATVHIANSYAAGVTRCFRTIGELWAEAAVIPGGRPVCRQCARQAAPVQVNASRTTSAQAARIGTATRITTAAKRAAGDAFRVETTSQGPYTFRTVIRRANPDSYVADLVIAGTAARNAIEADPTFSVTWGIVRTRTGVTVVLNTEDRTARRAFIEEATQRRHATMARELGYASVEAYLAAPGRAELIADPELSGYPAREEAAAAAHPGEPLGSVASAVITAVGGEDRTGTYPTLSAEEAQAALDAGLAFVPDGPGGYSLGVEVRSTHQRLGKVRAVTETLGEGVWFRFAAYRPDGSRVDYARTRLAAAQLLRSDASVR